MISLQNILILSNILNINCNYNGYVPHIHTAQHIKYTVDINNYPKSWSWANNNNTNYLTKNLNQHIPQYCGLTYLSTRTLSSLGGEIKMTRNAWSRY